MKSNKKSFTHDVFLSHNSKDKEIVRNIASELKNNGLRVWFDEWEIQVGDDIYLKIEEGLEKSKCLLLCMSPSCFDSDWVSLERSTVIFRDPVNRQRRFVPLLIKNCNIPDSVRRFKYIDFRKNDGNPLTELLKSLTDDPNSTNSSKKNDYPERIQNKIKQAKKSKRLGKFSEARNKWSLIDEFAKSEDILKLSIRARIETAVINVTEGYGSIEDALSIVDSCLSDLKATNLENELGEILHLLGEFYRIKKDFEKARNYLIASSEESLSKGNNHEYGWDMLSLAMLELDTKNPFDVQYAWTEKAFNAFSHIEISGVEKDKESASLGYANCHIVRAKCYGYSRPDEALSEYSKAIKIYKELGDKWMFDLALTLLERGDFQSTKRDAVQSINDLLEAGKIFSDLENQYNQAKCALAIAQLLDNVGQRTKSKEYYQYAFTIALQLEDETKIGLFQMRFAMKLLELQEVDEAKSLLNNLLEKEWLSNGQKLDVLERLSDSVRHPEADKNELKHYQNQVLEIVDNMLSESESSKDRLSLLINKGNAYSAMEKFDLAIDLYERSIELAKSISANDRIVDCWAHIAKAHSANENDNKEKQAYEKVLKLSEDYGTSMQTYTAHISLAQIQMKEKEFASAEEHLNKAEVGVKKILPHLMFVINDVKNRLEKQRNETN